MSDGGADALALDGGIIAIRPVRPGDRRALAGLYGDAAPGNLRMRFFARPSGVALAAEVDRLCRPGTDQHLAVVAVEGGRLSAAGPSGKESS